MNILVTGANGFVGRALAQRLQQDGHLGGRPISALHLLDLGFDQGGPTQASPAPGQTGAAAGQGLLAVSGASTVPAAVPVHPWAVDLGDAPALQAALAGLAGAGPLHTVFHLASIPGGLAEQQPELAQRVNIAATLALLEHGRTQVEAGQAAPVFVFASSIAVLGDVASLALVDDNTPPQPVLAYGSHKWVGEILLAAHSRRGWVDGRALRLPGVLARPPARTGQLSAFLSDLIRELAAGRGFTCPTGPQARTWASSLPCVVQQLLHAAVLPAAGLGPGRCVTPPTLHFSLAELVQAVGQVHGVPAAQRVQWAPEPRIEALFGRFPPLRTPRADAAGFAHDGDLAALVRSAWCQ